MSFFEEEQCSCALSLGKNASPLQFSGFSIKVAVESCRMCPFSFLLIKLLVGSQPFAENSVS